MIFKPRFALTVQSLFLASLLGAAVIGLAACTPKSSGGPASPAAPNSQAGMDGTVSGGGGNAIDGHMIENFAVPDISELPEFKKYISPILLSMVRGKPDVFVAYLNWTIHHKRWYFIPRELDKLPADRLALTFGSDQWARQSQSEIFIDAIQYRKKARKDQASLLLHEMVMGARFLMKRSPRDQCFALDSGNPGQDCDSESLLRLAKDKHLSADDQKTMDGEDTAAVRSMTVILTQQPELSSEFVRRNRQQLGFDYPWDQSVSQANLAIVYDAIVRGQLAEKVWMTPAHGTLPAMRCKIDDLSWDNHSLEFKVSGEDTALMNFPYLVTTDDESEAEGVLDPRNQKSFVDRVRLSPSRLDFYAQEVALYDFFLTRGEAGDDQPQVIEIDIRLARTKAGADPKKRPEIVPLSGPPTRCILAE
jgi:hypothetical protein